MQAGADVYAPGGLDVREHRPLRLCGALGANRLAILIEGEQQCIRVVRGRPTVPGCVLRLDLDPPAESRAYLGATSCATVPSSTAERSHPPTPTVPSHPPQFVAETSEPIRAARPVCDIHTADIDQAPLTAPQSGGARDAVTDADRVDVDAHRTRLPDGLNDGPTTAIASGDARRHTLPGDLAATFTDHGFVSTGPRVNAEHDDPACATTAVWQLRTIERDPPRRPRRWGTGREPSRPRAATSLPTTRVSTTHVGERSNGRGPPGLPRP